MRTKKLSRNAVKLTAVILMTMNHAAYVFPQIPQEIREWMISLGYFTAITMCYFLVEGYEKTSSREKYFKRLLIFAVISELPYCFGLSGGRLEYKGLNMIYTLLMCFLLIEIQKNCQDKLWKWLLTAAVFIATIPSDWALFAPFFTLLFVKSRESGEDPPLQAFVGSGLVFFSCNYAHILLVRQDSMQALFRSARYSVGLALSALVICVFYDKEKKPSKGSAAWKWFFYIYYPLHLLILGFVCMWVR